MIAEEVVEVNKDFVGYDKEGLVQSVAYSMLVTPMLKAIQEQNYQIQEQQSIIEKKEVEIENLKSRLKKIEEHLDLD